MADSDSAKDAPMQYNALSEFEAYVIQKKGTERAYVGEYTDMKDPARTSADSATRRCIWPSINSAAIVAGPVSMTRLPALWSAIGMKTAIALKSPAGIAADIWDMCSSGKDTLPGIRGTA